jgi:hypothetical protein
MKRERIELWAHILGNFGVVVTLVFLALEVRDNSKALRSQAFIERNATLTQPFLRDSELPAILAKIKSVDGAEPLNEAYIQRYELGYDEAAIWIRHVLAIWTTLEAEYALLGDSEGLKSRIRLLLAYPDQELWYDGGGLDWLSSSEFRSYVERVAAEP